MSEEKVEEIIKPKPTVGKKTRKKKDPSKPKRSMSAYMYFANAIRPVIKEEQPELTFVELTRAVAAKWGSVSDEEKAPYIAMAAKDKERYQAEKAALAETQ
uniref:HMG box domain-containing protein n=1 Tax=viral metagenome TaxID=1070528 RepID=A0A6C0BM28_9ZZZZ